MDDHSLGTRSGPTGTTGTNNQTKKISVLSGSIGDPSELMDDVGAGELFGVCPRTIRLWRYKKGLPHLALTSKCIRFRRSDLLAWAAGFHKGIS